MARKPEPLFEERNILGCHIKGCACAKNPRAHFPEIVDETEQERTQRIENEKVSWR